MLTPSWGKYQTMRLSIESYHQKEGVRDVKLGEDLSEDPRHMLKDLTRRYPDVFTDMPGETDVNQHRVKLTDDTPIRCKPYPLLYAMREELRNEVDSMLEMGVVRPSTLPYAMTIIMVKKKDGSHSVCVDFRKLNKITEVDPEPMIPVPSTQWHETPVQDRFDQRILHGRYQLHWRMCTKQRF